MNGTMSDGEVEGREEGGGVQAGEREKVLWSSNFVNINNSMEIFCLKTS